VKYLDIPRLVCLA